MASTSSSPSRLPISPAKLECLNEAKGTSEGSSAAKRRCGSRDEGFGVQVDLSCFFSDERATCWVWVVARRPVQWLAARLAHRLRLAACPGKGIALLAPRGLLHPRDPLALLCPGDIVRVVPVKSGTYLFEPDVEAVRSTDTGCVQTSTIVTCSACSGNELESRYEQENDCVMKNVDSMAEERALWGEATSPAAERSPSPLQQVKQRALDLLSRYELSLPHATSPPPARPHATSPPPARPHATSPPPARPHATSPPPARPHATSPPPARPHATSPPPARPHATSPPPARPHATSPPPARPHATRPRRRRVRRRPRLPAQGTDHTDAALSPTETPTTQISASPPASVPRDSSVVRNAQTTARALAPRLVRALAV